MSLKILVAVRELPIESAVGMLPAVASTWVERGHTVTFQADGAIDLRGGDVLLIEGNLNWFPKIVRALRKTRAADRSLVALWHREPLPPPRESGLPRPRLHLREWAKVVLRDPRTTDVHSNARRILAEFRSGTVDMVMATTVGRVEFLAEHGIPASWVPIAYDPSLGRPLGVARDIDTLFLGALDVPRRRSIVRRLRRSGLELRTAGSWFDPSFWGEPRTRLLNRTKILLNLSRTAGEFPDHRLLLGLSNKALVVSEPIYRPDPFVPGEHFVMSPIEEIAAVVGRYLADDAARERIVDAGHRFLTERHSLVQSADRILELLEAGLADRRRDAPAISAGSASRPSRP